jgi:hypothetical protein
VETVAEDHEETGKGLANFFSISTREFYNEEEASS